MFNYYYYTNSYYMLGNILVLVGVALMALAQMKVSSAYNKYSKVQNSRHLTGYDVAREILDQHGLSSVQIFEVQGRLSDHYNPSNQTLHLSRDIYHGTSIASLAVAAHECGHALQHQEGYRPLTFRNAIVPVCNFSYNLGWVAIMIGFLTLFFRILFISAFPKTSSDRFPLASHLFARQSFLNEQTTMLFVLQEHCWWQSLLL